MPVDGGNSIVFLCSPHVTSVRDILNLKLFISDMPMHDATRDLMMLNQSRICQMELKWALVSLLALGTSYVRMRVSVLLANALRRLCGS